MVFDDLCFCVFTSSVRGNRPSSALHAVLTLLRSTRRLLLQNLVCSLSCRSFFRELIYFFTVVLGKSVNTVRCPDFAVVQDNRFD